MTVAMGIPTDITVRLMIDTVAFAITNSVFQAVTISQYVDESELTKVQPAYVKAREYCRPLAEKWAEQMKDEKCITVLASGPAYGSGHIFSTCNILEMLQIQFPTFNSCDFFHGLFEITDKNKPFFLLVADGRHTNFK